MRYLVAQEIKSETKVSKNIYLFDFFFLIFYMTVSVMVGSLIVHESLRIFFYIYSFLAALFLTGKSRENRRRRNYESIAILLRRDRRVYHPVPNVSRKREDADAEEETELW